MTNPRVAASSLARRQLPSMVLPAYGRSSLADLLPSVAGRLHPVSGGGPLELPASDRYVVVLVDGLGWVQVRQALRETPYFASLIGDAQPLTCGVPSTTVTSLTSLGTGAPPGQHGMVGYTSRVPSTGEILNALTWESDLVPRSFQPRSTVFEQLAAAGVAVTAVSLDRFQHSGLTEAGLRGPDFVGFGDEADEDHRIELVVAAAARGDRSLVYAYERQLDHVGHADGCGSPRWLKHLIAIDAMLERLREALPPDVRVLITGDHGMVDVSFEHQVIAEDVPSLMAGLSALAGEGRLRQLYVDHDQPAAVARRWRDQLGERAWVRTRDEAIEEGWFGPVDDELLERYGHVLVAMRTDWAVMSRQWPREFTLIGMHGSLTEAEMLVPLFWD